MSEKTTKVRTTQRIVNPSHDPRKGDSDAVFAAGAEVSVPTSLAETWLADGRAEAVEDSKEDEVTIDEKAKKKVK